MPRFARLPLTASALLVVLSAVPALAQQQGDSSALEQCEGAFRQCMAGCEMAYPGDQAGEAGCQASCAADRAVCEARTGYEQAKPWVEEQFRTLQRFLEGFSRGGQGGAVPKEGLPPMPDDAPEPAPDNGGPGVLIPPEDTVDL